MSENTKIAAALLVAQKAAEAVGKTSTNKHHGFKYASAESMIAETRDHLHCAGLSVYGGDQTVIQIGNVFALRAVFIVAHESGDSMTHTRDLIFESGKGRPLDKALLGAATELLGYFLRDLLLIPRQEADVSGRDDRKHTPRKPAPKPPAKSEPPKPSNAEAVAKARGWIELAWGDDQALDACIVDLKGLGLDGEDYASVLAFFQEAKAACK